MVSSSKIIATFSMWLGLFFFNLISPSLSDDNLSLPRVISKIELSLFFLKKKRRLNYYMAILQIILLFVLLVACIILIIKVPISSNLVVESVSLSGILMESVVGVCMILNLGHIFFQEI